MSFGVWLWRGNRVERPGLGALDSATWVPIPVSPLIDCDLGQQNECPWAVPSHSESMSTFRATSQNCCKDLKFKKCECRTTQLKRSLQRNWDVECSGGSVKLGLGWRWVHEYVKQRSKCHTTVLSVAFRALSSLSACLAQCRAGSALYFCAQARG